MNGNDGRFIHYKDRSGMSRASEEHTEPVLVSDDGDAPEAPQGRLGFTGIQDAGQSGDIGTYAPAGSLIKSVTVSRWHTSYGYYEQFCRRAEELCGRLPPEGITPPYRPFFSYMPQYSQLDGAQFEYYIWLRSEIRNGSCPQADYSYILLLLYECIALSQKQPPEATLDLMVKIWTGYRKSYKRLDIQLSDWVCDFCLIHRLAAPHDAVRGFVKDVLQAASLREFYIDVSDTPGSLAGVLVQYCSNYDYTKSKFCTGDNIPLYVRHMTGVIGYILQKQGAAGLIGAGMQESVLTRDAYVGALCAPAVKKKLEITYMSLTHSYSVRFIVTDILKYAENRIRAFLGLKSRISCGKIPPEIKKLAEEYFDAELPVRAKRMEQEAPPEYEKLYEPVHKAVSIEAAAEIESLSWDLTERLVEAFDGGTEPEDTASLPESGMPVSGADAPTSAAQEISVPAAAETPDAIEASAEASCADMPGAYDAGSFLPYEIAFIGACVDSDAAAQRRICGECGKPAGMLAEEINVRACEITGDIILENSGSAYTVIADYTDEVLQLLQDTEKD